MFHLLKFIYHSRQLVIILLICLLSSMTCSGADPTKEDMLRVKETYLLFRFQQTFSEQLIQKSDAQLMQLSCAENYVNCDKTLELLKANEPDFYAKYLQIIQKETEHAKEN